MAEDVLTTRPSGVALLGREPITTEEQAAVARYDAALAALAAHEAAGVEPVCFDDYAVVNRLRMAVNSTATKLRNLAQGKTEVVLRRARGNRWTAAQRAKPGWHDMKRQYMRAWRAKQRFLRAKQEASG
jgi:hypothetical protein